MAVETNVVTLDMVNRVMDKRVQIFPTSVGKRVKLLITSNGNTIDVVDKSGAPVMSRREPGVVLTKTIFNTNGTSMIAYNSQRAIQYFSRGCKCESTGGKIKGTIKGKEDLYSAHDYFNAFLNITQVSFGILLPSALIEQGLISRGVEIAGRVELITSEEGSLLTIDGGTISVQAPETLSSGKFSKDAMLAAAAALENADEDVVVGGKEPVVPETQAELTLRLKKEKADAAKVKKDAKK